MTLAIYFFVPCWTPLVICYGITIMPLGLIGIDNVVFLHNTITIDSIANEALLTTLMSSVNELSRDPRVLEGFIKDLHLWLSHCNVTFLSDI
nr:MAG TPA: hypothetical protein [Caudoviricetes sp.]